jgi:hypothetical protein
MTDSIPVDFVYQQRSYQAELQPVQRQQEIQYEVISIDPDLKDVLNGFLFFELENGLVTAGDEVVTGEAAPLRQAIASALENYLLNNGG